MSKQKIALIVGSKSDLEVVKVAEPYLEFFNIDCTVQTLSAHRQHSALVEYLKKLENSDCRLIIACAGMAAHLPGVVAALTDLPVVGVPLVASSLNGMDALLSIVQMPKGIPVATMTIGEAGVINAVVYAARVLALADSQMQAKLHEFRQRGSKLA